MELTFNKDQELRQRARAWFYVIGFSSGDSEDIIQDAMLKLYRWHEQHLDVDQDDFADKNWVRCIRQAFASWCRTTKRYSALLERYADSIVEHRKREAYIDEARAILIDVLPKLSESDLIVLLALMDNGFNKVWAATDLGCAKQHIYQTLSRIRNRLSKDYDFRHNKHTEKEAPYVPILVKTGNYNEEDAHWNMFHPFKTEVVRAETLTRRGFRDIEEEEKVWPVTVIKGANYASDNN